MLCCDAQAKERLHRLDEALYDADAAVAAAEAEGSAAGEARKLAESLRRAQAAAHSISQSVVSA
jgi:hypothetical protein